MGPPFDPLIVRLQLKWLSPSPQSVLDQTDPHRMRIRPNKIRSKICANSNMKNMQIITNRYEFHRIEKNNRRQKRANILTI